MADPGRGPTNLRTLLILEVLGRSDRPMTATEINEELGLPKQTVHRLCATLEREGFLTRHENSRSYHPSRRLRQLGAGLLFNARHHIARRQILMDVARQTGETVNFVVPRAEGMSYQDRVETDWAVRIQLPIGAHVPFHCTASGKCFLASHTPKQRRALVGALDLRAMTAHTHVTAETLLEDLARVARQGYSLDEEEFLDGMVAIAVPVLSPADRFVAALAIHGPSQRLSTPDMVARRALLHNASRRLTSALFDV